MTKQRNRLKRFRKFENIEHNENYYMEIYFGYIFRNSTKPDWKDTRIEAMENGLKEYQDMIKGVLKKLLYVKKIFNVILTT